MRPPFALTGALLSVTCVLAGCPPTQPATNRDAPLAGSQAVARELDAPAPPASSSVVSASAAPPASPPPQEVARRELLTSCSEPRKIIVRKALRTLELRCGDALVSRYDTSLGPSPEGHKLKEGDGRTPEGDYIINLKYPSQYHRTLRLGYPNAADADAGLAAGVITQAQHAAILSALTRCKDPPQTTPLGSLLEIHGAGGGRDVGDWTLGCVAVDNAEIEEVFAFHQPGCNADGSPKVLVRILP